MTYSMAPSYNTSTEYLNEAVSLDHNVTSARGTTLGDVSNIQDNDNGSTSPIANEGINDSKHQNQTIPDHSQAIHAAEMGTASESGPTMLDPVADAHLKSAEHRGTSTPEVGPGNLSLSQKSEREPLHNEAVECASPDIITGSEGWKVESILGEGKGSASSLSVVLQNLFTTDRSTGQEEIQAASTNGAEISKSHCDSIDGSGTVEYNHSLDPVANQESVDCNIKKQDSGLETDEVDVVPSTKDPIRQLGSSSVPNSGKAEQLPASSSRESPAGRQANLSSRYSVPVLAPSMSLSSLHTARRREDRQKVKRRIRSWMVQHTFDY